MSLDEKIRELDEHIAGRVKQWLREQHELLGRKLGDEIARQLDGAGDSLPPSLISAEQIAELEAAATAAEAPSEAPAQASAAALLEAVGVVDQARSQVAALSALLSEGSRFASRLAVFLIRSGEAVGWRSEGFGDAEGALRSLSVAFRDGGPWDRLAQGRAGVRMSAADCARLCSRIEAPLPKRGLLIPLILRDQVAAAVYADQVGDDGALEEAALQLLAHSTALAIETMPFREREMTTPTLVLESQGSDDAGQGLSLWGSGGAPASPETAEAQTEAEAGDEAALHEPEEEGEEASTYVLEPASEEPGAAPVVSETQDVGPMLVGVLEDDDTDSETGAMEEDEESVSAFPYEVSDQDEPELLEAEPRQEASASPDFEQPETLTWQDDVEIVEEAEVVEEAEPSEEAQQLDSPPEDDLEVWEVEPADTDDDDDEPPSAEPEVLESVATEAESLRTLHYPLPPVEDEEEPEPTDDGYPEPDETVLLSRPPELKPPEDPSPPEGDFDGDETHPGMGSPPPGAAAAPPPPSGRPSEVAPPSDIEGPGWAFADRSKPQTADDEMHEKAKRLARLLVSEIKLYNEEQVEEGQRNKDIYERLKEDIDRSRQMYDDRVDERVRSTNDYFYQELVRTLAAGDPQALGI